MSPSRRGRALVAATLTALLAPAAAAQAETLLETTLAAPETAEHACTSGLAAGGAVASRTLDSPAGGWVTARLHGDDASDWDLAIFDRGTGRLVGGSTSFGMTEVAQGIVARGAALVVQACRRSGEARTAGLSVKLDRVDASKPVEVQMVEVIVPSESRHRDLERLGLDMSDHGGENSHNVILYGEKDAEKLRRAKFRYRLLTSDLMARRRARAQAGPCVRRPQPGLRPAQPADHLPAAAGLHERHEEARGREPHLVRKITLPFKT